MKSLDSRRHISKLYFEITVRDHKRKVVASKLRVIEVTSDVKNPKLTGRITSHEPDPKIIIPENQLTVNHTANIVYN